MSDARALHREAVVPSRGCAVARLRGGAVARLIQRDVDHFAQQRVHLVHDRLTRGPYQSQPIL